MMEDDSFAGAGKSAQLSELRWHAACKAAKEAQTECDLLLRVIEEAQRAWRLARSRLDAYEKLRDAFDQSLQESFHQPRQRGVALRMVISAA